MAPRISWTLFSSSVEKKQSRRNSWTLFIFEPLLLHVWDSVFFKPLGVPNLREVYRRDGGVGVRPGQEEGSRQLVCVLPDQGCSCGLARGREVSCLLTGSSLDCKKNSIREDFSGLKKN